MLCKLGKETDEEGLAALARPSHIATFATPGKERECLQSTYRSGCRLRKLFVTYFKSQFKTGLYKCGHNVNESGCKERFDSAALWSASMFMEIAVMAEKTNLIFFLLNDVISK